MKKLFLLMVNIVLFTIPLQAQLVRREKTGFNRISLGYEVLFHNDEFPAMDGGNLQYAHGFRIAKYPLFIETGVHVSFNYNAYCNAEIKEIKGIKVIDGIEYAHEDFLRRCISVSVPLGISYRVQFGEKYSIQPYIGLNFRTNPVIDYRYTNSIYYKSGDHTKYEGGEYSRCKVQFGGQIGLGLNLSRLYIGVQYDIDFIPIATISLYEYYYNGPNYVYDLKSSRLSLNIGINF